MKYAIIERVVAIRLLCLMALLIVMSIPLKATANELPLVVNDPIADLIAEVTKPFVSELPWLTPKAKATFITPVPTDAWKAKYGPHILSAAKQNNVSPNLVMAIIAVESGFNHLARSGDGATGLMQIKYPTARAYGLDGSRGSAALLDPITNIRVATNYLGAANKLARGNQCAALSRYNRGLGSSSLNAAYCAKVAKVMRYADFQLE